MDAGFFNGRGMLDGEKESFCQQRLLLLAGGAPRWAVRMAVEECRLLFVLAEVGTCRLTRFALAAEETCSLML
ncbi:hypothetical protein SAMN04487969_10586 [Paenibacillus algorifonticola]|uniref:Uncharacterized protein n=1 Tax=Paenibacillus algorifonticola TaxID=684063 RepID=A0A1I2CJC0_9BACL|nr:hypothetical protein [Paenibacillus algorifonticola]SFE67913.1 hypothetical protein SAMN04487969_10586 [Paenibacillus algorifonticola]